GSVTFNYSQSHDPEGTGKYHWSLDPGNGSPLQTGAGAGPFTISYQYPGAGPHTAQFSVTNDSGGLTRQGDQTQGPITQPVLTVASVTLDDYSVSGVAGNAGQSLTAKAWSGAGGTGTQITGKAFSWNSDNTAVVPKPTGTGATITLTYTAAGTAHITA